MSDWYPAGMEDDMRPRMFEAAGRGRPFALVTIVAAEGGGPRGVGAQMVVTADDMGGFLSGGCIEADVALHARECLVDGEPRRLVYGRGSPFVDARLPCGGRLELLVERLEPDDDALADLRTAWGDRRPGVYVSDGHRRSFGDEGEAGPDDCCRPYAPQKRLIVFGSDAFALAIAAAGTAQGWAVVLCRPKGPEAPPPLDVTYSREEPEVLLSRLKPDAWTAVATATHEGDLDHEVLKAALPSDAGYVGVLGARRRLPERLERLHADGVGESALMRLKAPIGLSIGARSPAEVATSVTAEIIAALR